MKDYYLRSRDYCVEITKEEYEDAFINHNDISEDKRGYCYFIQVLPEALTHTHIYKIGRATNIFKGVYSREYQNIRPICTREVSDMYECEYELIETFNKYFHKCDSQYYKGNEFDMLMIFNEICDNYTQGKNTFDISTIEF